MNQTDEFGIDGTSREADVANQIRPQIPDGGILSAATVPSGEEASLPDADRVRAAIERFVSTSPNVELRAIYPIRDSHPPATFWVNSETIEQGTAWAVKKNREGYSVYCTFNRIDIRPEGAAKDGHVAARNFILIDFDPKRAVDTASTEGDRKQAGDVAGRVQAFLAEHGWTKPAIVNDSGNGVHLFYRADLPTDDGKLVNALLKGLNARFGGEEVKIDSSVSNPSRIVRLPGTVNTKGQSHRMCQTLEINEGTDPVGMELLERTVGLLTPPAPTKVSKPRKSPTQPKEEPKSGARVTLAAGVAPVVNGPWEQVPVQERIRLCRAWLTAIPGSDLPQSGSHGHDNTFRLVKAIANDFALFRDRDACLTLARELNDRLELYGDDWTADELAHKVDDAINSVGTNPEFPVGCKLSPSTPPMAWDNPARLAAEFREHMIVRFVKDTAFSYDGRAYRVVGDDWLRATVRAFLERQAVQEFDRATRDWTKRHGQQLEGLKSRLASLSGDQKGELAEIAEQKGKRVEREIEKLQRKRPRLVPAVTEAMVANTLGAIRARGQLPDDTGLDQWLRQDGGPTVVAVANGLLDPATRTLHPFSPDWFSTAQVPVAFDSDAPRPEKWLSFLDEIMEGDTQRIAVIQEIFGAFLDRTYHSKWFVALVGGGDNGKSVLLTVLRLMLGQSNCSAVNLDELSSNRFASFGLFGKLANIVGDQGYLESHDEGRLKSLTGGDLVPFEQKGRDVFYSVNRAKLAFACNSLPTFGDKSEAIWNRLVVIPFNFTVPAGKKDSRLLEAGYWEGELPGILVWALDGLKRLRETGRLSGCGACDQLRGEHRMDSNPARRFLLEDYEFTGNDTDLMPVAALYSRYRRWGEDAGLERWLLTEQRFAKEVDATFPGIGKATTKRVEGIPRRVRVGLKRREEAGEGNEVTTQLRVA